MRFVASDMPGPLVQPYVKELRDLEQTAKTSPIPISAAARYVFEADLDRKAQGIIARCILAKPSLG